MLIHFHWAATVCQHVLAIWAKERQIPPGAICLRWDSQRHGWSAVPGETQDATRPSQRRDTKEGRGDGKVVFQGHRWKFVLGLQGIRCQSADEPIPHLAVPKAKSSPCLFVQMVPLVHLIILVSYPSCFSVAKSCPSHQLPYPSLSPWVCSNSCQWYHPTISSSVVLFSCPQSFPASGSFSISQLFETGGQSIGASTSAPVLPMNTQVWFPLGLTCLILLSKGLSRVFLNTTVRKRQFFGAQPPLWSNSHIHIWLLGKW